MSNTVSAETGSPAAAPARRGLSVRAFLVAYMAVGVLLGVFHLILGADVLVVACAVSALIVSALPALKFGLRDMPSLLSFLFGIRYTTSALAWKLVEGAALDSGLYAPLTSFNVVLVGLSALAAAAFCAHIVWPSRPVFVEHYNERGYAFLLVTSAGLVVMSLLLSFSGIRLPGGVEKLIGNGALILPMAYMGFNVYSSKVVITPGLLATLGGFTMLSLAFNSREGALQMLLAALVMYLCFGFRLNRALLATLAVLGAIFVFVIAPAMTDARAYRDSANPVEMIGHTLSAIEKRLTGEVVETLVDPGASRYRLTYLQTRNNFLDRIVGVQQLDFIVALAEQNGPIGTERFWAGLWELLPSAIVPDKTVTLTPSYVLIVYGIYTPGSESRIEQTGFGSAFSYGGFEFLIYAVFIGFFVFFLFLRLFCPRLENSIFAAFVLMSYGHALSGGHIWAVYSAVMRSLPFEVVLFWIANMLSRQRPTAQAAGT